jgi:hypothetical protein
MQYYKTASIMLGSGGAKNSISDIFIAQPDADKEALAGKLFLILEISSDNANALKIINFLINNLNHNYYNNEKIILRERISSLKVEHIFESALAKTNAGLADFLNREKIKLNPLSINASVGVIYENNIHFAAIGTNKSFLIYKEKEGEHKIIDVNKKTGSKTEKIKLNKIFSDIISGEIPDDGYFLFTNEALPEYFSSKHLVEIITKLPPGSAMEQIKNTLLKVNSYVSFLGILIKNTEKLKTEEEDDVLLTDNKNLNSIDKLNNTEEETEKLLSPSGMINYGKWSGFIKKYIKKIFSKENKNKTSIFIKDKIFIKRKKPLIAFKKTALIIKDVLIYIFNLLFLFIKTVTSKEGLKSISTSFKNIFKKTQEKIILFFKNIACLSFKNKIVISVGLISLILFVSATSIKILENKKEEEKKIIEDLIAVLEQKQNQIDANLLYGNEDGAKKLINEASVLIEEILQKTDEEENYEKYIEKNEAHLEKIRRELIIENFSELADFSNLNSNSYALNIILSNNKIYAGDSGQKTIYMLDLNDNTATAITDLSADVKNLTNPAKDNQDNIYYLNFKNPKEELSLIRLSDNNDIEKIEISIPDNAKNIIANASFNNMPYLLDNENNQIYRLRNFTGTDWLNEGYDIVNASDIAIDGSIYILLKDGQVRKFSGGAEDDFNIDSIEPIFSEADKITLSDNFIYIMESVNKRLAVFEKESGDFILQYKLKDFDNLKDFEINEENKKLYFLVNNSVIETEATHLD